MVAESCIAAPRKRSAQSDTRLAICAGVGPRPLTAGITRSKLIRPRRCTSSFNAAYACVRLSPAPEASSTGRSGFSPSMRASTRASAWITTTSTS